MAQMLITGRNKKYAEKGVVICLVVYYYIYEINQLLNLYKDAGGIWHEDRFRPLVTAIANVSMNLIMVQFWGIIWCSSFYGTFYDVCWNAVVVSQSILGMSSTFS